MYQNSIGSENKKIRNWLSDEAQQQKEQGEMAKEEIVQRLKQLKLDSQYAKFLTMFKNLDINIPFVEALAQNATLCKIHEGHYQQEEEVE